ncbi:serine hydroxymethyltransferase [Clostridium botulinum CFSAN002367]|nr:serine hydroxymethyltransferase [Clostridium botulinum CFSAN002369]EPS51082.1 serine hydroxymethyltransferase [Clostridium botulinum CFSAN002367]
MNYSIEHREENLSQIKEQIKEICKKYPLYQNA